jgi:hypothetical protein
VRRSAYHARFGIVGVHPDIARFVAARPAPTAKEVKASIAKAKGEAPTPKPVAATPRVEESAPQQVAPAAEKQAFPKSVSAPGTYGSDTVVKTPTGDIPAKYKIVEAANLLPSHDAETFAKNPGYPEGVQERTYHTSKEAQARVIEQGDHYDPAYTVNTNPDAVNGPPVVTKSGVVLGGNSRAMATQRVYRRGGGDAYRNAIGQQAAQFGLDPEAVKDYSRPVLVREIPNPETIDEARQLGSTLNKNMTGALGVSEKAVSAGKAITTDTLQQIQGMGDQIGNDATLRDVMAKRGNEVLQMLVRDGAITDRERPQFIDTATGGLSEGGKDFVERALVGKALDDPDLMERAPKSILRKIGSSLFDIVSVASRTDEYNLLPLLREAVGEHADIAERGSDVETHLAQTGMFGPERNPAVDAMVRKLAEKPSAVNDAIRQFTQDANFDKQGQGMMLVAEQPSPVNAFNSAVGTKFASEDEFQQYLIDATEKQLQNRSGVQDVGSTEKETRGPADEVQRQPSQSPAQEKSVASVKAFVTKTDEAKLRDLGYTQEQIDHMTPEEAQGFLKPEDTTMGMSVPGVEAVPRVVKGLVDQDLKPVFAKAAEVFKELRDVITPRAGVPVKTLDTVMGRLGQRERHIFDLDNQLDKVEKAVDKVPREQQIAFVDQFKRGQEQETPELRKQRDDITAIDEASAMRTVNAQVRLLGEGAQKLWSKLSKDERLDFFHNSTQFGEDAAAALAKGDLSRKEERDMRVRQELADHILDYKENHLRVLWEVIPGKEAGDEGTERGLGSVLGKRRPFQGSKGFLKQSTLADMSEGLERGGEPYSYNYITMLKRSVADAERYSTALDIWSDAKEQGARVFVKRGAQGPDGFSKVGDRIGNVSFKAESGEGQIQAGEWYLRDDYAKLLNNFLSNGWIDKSAAVQGIMSAKNQLTMYRLGFSPFHALVETVSGIGSEVGLGVGELANSLRGGGIKSAARGLRDLLSAVAAPYTRTELGTSAIRYVTDKDEFLKTLRGQDFAKQYPEADAILDRMFASGAKLGLHPDEALHSIGKLKQAWADADWGTNPIGASAKLLFHSPGAINQQVMKPLFNYYIPRIKLGSFLREYSAALVDHQEDIAAGQMTEGQLGRKTWDSIENVFGQVNWDKFFWHKNTKTATQILFRAAQWASGNVRLVKDAGVGQFKEFAESAAYITAKVHGEEYQGYKSTRAVPRLDPDMGKLLGILMVATIANLAMQRALTGEGPKGDADAFAARTGKLDSHGKPIRIMTPAIVLTDAISLQAHGAGRYLSAKVSDLMAGIWDVITNRDYQGNMINNPDDAWWEPKSLWRDTKHVAGLPIGVSQVKQLSESGASPKEAALGAAGFKPGPTRLEWSKAETAAYDLLQAKRGPKTTEEQQETNDYMERRASGNLSLQEHRSQMKNAGKSFLVKTMQALVRDNATLAELKRIEEKATPEEKSQINILMLHARMSDLRKRIGRPVAQP